MARAEPLSFGSWSGDTTAGSERETLREPPRRGEGLSAPWHPKWRLLPRERRFGPGPLQAAKSSFLPRPLLLIAIRFTFSSAAADFGSVRVSTAGNFG